MSENLYMQTKPSLIVGSIGWLESFRISLRMGFQKESRKVQLKTYNKLPNLVRICYSKFFLLIT